MLIIDEATLRDDEELPDDDAATIAGLVIQIGRVIPDEGQIFTFEGFRFQIASRRKNRLALIHITPPGQLETETSERSSE